MFFRSLLLVLLTVVPAAHAQILSSKRKPVIRSGQVITCYLARGCTEEKIGGRPFSVLQADGFTIKAAVVYDPSFSYADVTIVNGTRSKVSLLPAEFRIEVTEPRFTRLSYVTPARAKAAVKPPRHQSGGLPLPSYFTSPEHMKEKQAQAAASIAAPPLQSGYLAPGETRGGRVFFERTDKATNMNLVIPISGALFEFPYTPPPPVKK